MGGWSPTDSAVKVARKPLTSAQVLAIFTTPVTIVPAPGAGMAIVPIAANVLYDFVSTPYTDNGGALVLWQGTTGTGFSLTSAGFWTQGSSQFSTFGTSSSSSHAITAVANKALVIANNTANPTLGNGTLTVTVAYLTVPVS